MNFSGFFCDFSQIALCQSFAQGDGGCCPAKYTALGSNHFEGYPLKFRKVRCHAIREDKAFKSTIIGFSDGGMHTHFSRHTGYNQAFDVMIL